MKQMTSEVKQQQLGWRRAQVLELASAGYTQREIASKLQVDLAAVNRDIQFLRQQAQENLQKHIHETVPEEYQKGMVGLRQNLKHVLEIAETASDPRIKLQARAIANESYKIIMDLATNGVIVNDALRFIQSKIEHLNTLNKQNNDYNNKIEPTEEGNIKTTNGVF
jgi:DNA-binding transcriptional regulator LsrR (DeoR family)